MVARGTAQVNIFETMDPFTILDFIEGNPLSKVLRVPPKKVLRKESVDELLEELLRKTIDGKAVDDPLSPDIDDGTLASLYRQMGRLYV